jgi:septal ring factor EnvC (AmiA/AmiB activator)
MMRSTGMGPVGLFMIPASSPETGNKMRWTAPHVLAAIAVLGWGAALSAFAIYSEQNAGLRAHIAQMEAAAGKLADVETSQAAARRILEAARTELTATSEMLAAKRADLEKVGADLTASRLEYDGQQAKLSNARTTLASLEDEIKKAQDQLIATASQAPHPERTAPPSMPPPAESRQRSAAAPQGKKVGPDQRDGSISYGSMDEIVRSLCQSPTC